MLETAFEGGGVHCTVLAEAYTVCTVVDVELRVSGCDTVIFQSARVCI